MHGRQEPPEDLPASSLHGRLRDAFLARFGRSGTCAAFAPGRVNLIGEHIDYCGGTVLPMPVQHGTWVLGARSGEDVVRASSLDAEAAVVLDPDGDAALPMGHWGRFVAGAVAVARNGHRRSAGLDLYVAGDIPGSGLSSSASLSVALLQVITHLNGRPLNGLALARAAQRIEHEFVGVGCGLMDQAAIVLGEAHCALLFDCASARYRPVEVDEALSIVVADSGVRRALTASAYNERRSQIAGIAGALGVAAERLAPTLAAPPGLAAASALTDPLLRRRAAHVATEQARVGSAVDALERRDFPRFGGLLNESHASLRDDYQVSCPELDALAESLACQPGCHGARMTGAGFGGSVVAAVDTAALAAVIRAASRAYLDRSGIEARMFRARSAGGARLDG